MGYAAVNDQVTTEVSFSCCPSIRTDCVCIQSTVLRTQAVYSAPSGLIGFLRRPASAPTPLPPHGLTLTNEKPQKAANIIHRFNSRLGRLRCLSHRKGARLCLSTYEGYMSFLGIYICIDAAVSDKNLPDCASSFVVILSRGIGGSGPCFLCRLPQTTQVEPRNLRRLWLR
jgi:hypothetical protein